MSANMRRGGGDDIGKIGGYVQGKGGGTDNIGRDGVMLWAEMVVLMI